MSDTTYQTKRSELKAYFDKTAKDNWVALTSNTPVSRIRQTVRAGREEMRQTLLSWLPADLSGVRLLDAGCGTGSLSVAAAQRGADVVAIDISPALIEEAASRAKGHHYAGSVCFMAGDMTNPYLGSFDFIVAMDSLIHYPLSAVIPTLETMAGRTTKGILFTFAPKTPVLAAMKSVGKFFPKNDRSPSIEPVAETKLIEAIRKSEIADLGFTTGRKNQVSTGFYKSCALELTRS